MVRGLDGAPLRPLKLIIMSATLRVDDFVANPRLFPVAPPQLLTVRSRRLLRCAFKHDPGLRLRQEALAKTTKIHARLPPGGILVFPGPPGDSDLRQEAAPAVPTPEEKRRAEQGEEGAGRRGGGGNEGGRAERRREHGK